MIKRFALLCNKCNFRELSTGLTKDLEEYTPVKTCTSCNGPRTYKCKKCSGTLKLMRIKGNV